MTEPIFQSKYAKEFEMDMYDMEVRFLALTNRIRDAINTRLEDAALRVLKSSCPKCGLTVRRAEHFSQPSKGREWTRVWCDRGHMWDGEVVVWSDVWEGFEKKEKES